MSADDGSQGPKGLKGSKGERGPSGDVVSFLAVLFIYLVLLFCSQGNTRKEGTTGSNWSSRTKGINING